MKNLLFIFICLFLLSCKKMPVEYAEEEPLYLGNVVEINPHGSTLIELGEVALEDSTINKLVDSLKTVHEETDTILASVFITVDAAADTAIEIYDLK